MTFASPNRHEYGSWLVVPIPYCDQEQSGPKWAPNVQLIYENLNLFYTKIIKFRSVFWLVLKNTFINANNDICLKLVPWLFYKYSF
jgi:hypothetical protein